MTTEMTGQTGPWKFAKMCDYKLSNWRECGHRAHFIAERVSKNGRKFIYSCADHSTADAVAWPSVEATNVILRQSRNLGQNPQVVPDRQA